MVVNVIPTPEQMAIVETPINNHPKDDVYNSPEIMKIRQDICFKCEYYNNTEMKCNECGCPVIMMSQFNFKECPKGYWE